jgi:hypothetical protein
MRRKALALLSGFSYIDRPVKIIKHRRKVGGSLVTLCDFFWRKEEPWAVVQLSSGKRTAIPLEWTDVPKSAIPVLTAGPQIEALRLLEMAAFCQQLLSRKKNKRRRRSSKKT